MRRRKCCFATRISQQERWSVLEKRQNKKEYNYNKKSGGIKI